MDWADLERELHAAGVSPEEIEAGARQVARPGPRAPARRDPQAAGPGPEADRRRHGRERRRVSQIEHGEVTSFEVIARYVEALGGRLDLVADFGDRTVRLPVSDTASAA
jgi:hypothetical protein